MQFKLLSQRLHTIIWSIWIRNLRSTVAHHNLHSNFVKMFYCHYFFLPQWYVFPMICFFWQVIIILSSMSILSLLLCSFTSLLWLYILLSHSISLLYFTITLFYYSIKCCKKLNFCNTTLIRPCPLWLTLCFDQPSTLTDLPLQPIFCSNQLWLTDFAIVKRKEKENKEVSNEVSNKTETLRLSFYPKRPRIHACIISYSDRIITLLDT